MNHYVYKLIPPRPTFGEDQTEDEGAIMGAHVQYWSGLFEQGSVVAYGPVDDPAGMWGLAVVGAESEDAIHAIVGLDPAVSSGMATYAVYSMPVAIVRQPAQ